MAEDQPCRACLQWGAGDPAHIFNRRHDDEPLLSDMLLACVDTTVQRDDAFPKTLCSSCVADLRIAYNFKLMCQSSYRWLLENYHPIKEENASCKDLIKIEKTKDAELSQTELCDVKNNNSNGKIEAADEFKPDDYDDNNEPELFNFNFCGNPTYASRKVKTKKKCQTKTQKNNNESSKKKKAKLKKSELPKIISCNQCPKKFAFPYMLRMHIQTHASCKSYFCHICKKYYNSEKDHTKIHRYASKFTCDVCSKCFNTRAKIASHLETHSNNRTKAFICDLLNCGKAYLSYQGLNRHKLVHSGARNFLCHVCSKAFFDKTSLELHMSHHYKERAYKCRICERSFLNSNNRRAHETRHNSERRFSCSRCEKRFINGSVLRRHMLTHTRQLPNQCAFCPKKFSRKDNKSRHEFVMHGFSGIKEKSVFISDLSKRALPDQ